MADLDIDLHTYDIPRKVSVYPDKDGIQWWIKSWFNNRKVGEKAIQITRQIAIQFIQEDKTCDEWLDEYYPRQMDICRSATAQAREQLINMLRKHN